MRWMAVVSVSVSLLVQHASAGVTCKENVEGEYNGKCYPINLVTKDGSPINPLQCHGPEQDKEDAQSIAFAVSARYYDGMGGDLIRLLIQKEKICRVPDDSLSPGLAAAERQYVQMLESRINDKLATGRVDINSELEDYQSLGLATDRVQAMVNGWKQQVAAMPAAQKKSCGDVQDIQPQLGPVRTQQFSGLCYAFAASDLIGFKLHRLDIAAGKSEAVSELAVPVSYFDLAVQERLAASPDLDLNAQWSPTKMPVLSGGNIFDTVNAAATNGVCSVDKFPDNVNAYNAITWQVNAVLTNGRLDSYYQLTPKMAEVLLQKPADGKNASFQTMIDQACAPRSMILSINDIRSFDSANKMTKQVPILGVNEGMDQHVPILIGVREKIVGGAHAMLVVGRQWNDKAKQCDYIVRNSWGPCKSGNAATDKALKTMLDKNDIQCINDHLYIHHDVLADDMDQAVYIK